MSSTARNLLIVTGGLCGIMFGCAGSAAACGSLDAIGSLAPGFGNACVDH